MKAPVFWYQPRGWVARALMPMACLYRLGGAIRRLRARPYRAKIPVICVGNVVVGGAGKTPTALAIAEMLRQDGHTPVFVTRGYGGTERGPLRVDPTRHTAKDVGDEALLLARAAPVWIGRDRAAAIRATETAASHIILDDGFQNPHITPDIRLLVVDAAVGLGNGCILPAGPLREPWAEAEQRATAVIAIGGTLPAGTKQGLAAHTEPVLPNDFPSHERFFAFAGIGRPEKFYATCRAAGLTLVGTQDFPDHHPFSTRDLDSLTRQANAKSARLVTTEKDWVRLPHSFRDSVHVLPIRLIFAEPDSAKTVLYGSPRVNCS